jgi:hypothetical protein
MNCACHRIDIAAAPAGFAKRTFVKIASKTA